MTAIMSRRDLLSLSDSARIYVFGTGMAGQRLRAVIERQRGQRITGFVDSFCDGVQDSVPVIRPDRLMAEDGDDLVVVVASQQWADILPSLQGLRHGRVLNGYFLAHELERPQALDVASCLFPLTVQNSRSGYETLVTDLSGLETALDGLTASGDQGGESLLSALRHIVCGELFFAVANLYAWLRTADAGAALQPTEAGSLAVSVLRVGAPVPADRRFADLEALGETAMAGCSLFAEAIALALARVDAVCGRLRSAERRLTALAARPAADPRWAHFADDALFALGHLMRGEPLPMALAHLVGDDPGYLKERICAQPFKRFDIQPNGDVMVCCSHWLPSRIGNIHLDAPEDILNSPTVRDIRRSMLDGSYKYCRLAHCPIAQTGALDIKHRSVDPVAQWAAETQSDVVDKAHSVVVAFDQSCNLSCPSCRTDIMADRGALRDVKVKAADRVILPLLRRARQVLINSAGEVFASKPSRHILHALNRRDFPDLEVDIISNGTLFSEAEWAKFPGIHDMIGYVRISVDAVTRTTFETLRRGGRYDVFCRNMEFLARLRREGIIPRLAMSFTYQVDNFREMPEFVRWSQSCAADYITFEKLENIVFSGKDYDGAAVHQPSHPQHADFRRILAHPSLRDPIVRIDLPLEALG